MYSYEKRMKAVLLHRDAGMGLKKVMKTLGYPRDIKVLRQWCREYQSSGTLHSIEGYAEGYSPKQKAIAVAYYWRNGDLKRTRAELGYPTTTLALKSWIEEIAVLENKRLQSGHNPVKCVQEPQTEAGNTLPIQENLLVQAADPHKDPAFLMKLLQGRLTPMTKKKQEPTTASLLQEKEELVRAIEALRKDEETLRKQKEEAEEKVKVLENNLEKLSKQTRDQELEYRALEIASALIKKDGGVSLKDLTNREKAIVIDALCTKYEFPLKRCLQLLALSKSSYYYQRRVLLAGDKYAEFRKEIKEIFENNFNAYGYRRIWKALRNNGKIVSEKVVQRIMKEDQLVPYFKRRKKYSSYEGEPTPAVSNVIERHFNADKPNEKFLTDITEFNLTFGKLYLSVLIDCFDGMLVSWGLSTSPNAKLVNTMLDDAKKLVNEDDHPTVHSDRGIQYFWQSWRNRMNEFGWTRSMSKKGCSPDNAACEGFFGRMKNEIFYGRDWQGISLAEFKALINRYLHWYNEDRIKMSLGGMSPVQYRISLGLLPTK